MVYAGLLQPQTVQTHYYDSYCNVSYNGGERLWAETCGKTRVLHNNNNNDKCIAPPPYGCRSPQSATTTCTIDGAFWTNNSDVRQRSPDFRASERMHGSSRNPWTCPRHRPPFKGTRAQVRTVRRYTEMPANGGPGTLMVESRRRPRPLISDRRPSTVSPQDRVNGWRSIERVQT